MYCCRRLSISITYSECVFVALVIQHTKRARFIMLSSVACLAIPRFFHIISNGTNFEKKNIDKKCVF